MRSDTVADSGVYAPRDLCDFRVGVQVDKIQRTLSAAGGEGVFFYGLGQHKPAEKDSGIHNNRMVKERAHNMSVQQGIKSGVLTFTSGTVVSGQIVQNTAIRREYPHYFQDVEVNSPEAVAPPQDITVQPKDQISIVVSSKDPELAALFNLTRVQQRVGSTGLNNSNNNGEISGYTLDDKGAIDFSRIGKPHCGGHDPKPDCRIGKTKAEGGTW